MDAAWTMAESCRVSRQPVLQRLRGCQAGEKDGAVLWAGPVVMTAPSGQARRPEWAGVAVCPRPHLGLICNPARQQWV